VDDIGRRRQRCACTGILRPACQLEQNGLREHGEI